jgi:hypothetical protein
MQAPTRFRYVEHTAWPPLAWLAKATVGCTEVEVRHGNMVETADDWFCEAVWDGPFEAGDFDQTDLIFGSGARRRSTTARFISCGSTCDRLQSLQLSDSIWISNSLACLLTTTGASLDPADSDYATFFASIVKGIREYDRYLPTSLGPVRFTYFNNLSWNGRTVTEETKPNPSRDFRSFDKYRSFLHASMASVVTNMASSARKHPFSMLGTLSSGYDSPAVVALACEHGLTEAISITTARGGDADSGVEIAKVVNVRPWLIDREAWKAHSLPEVPFLAADASGGDVFLGGASGRLSGRVLLTGQLGGKVWARAVPVRGHELARGDHGGLSLCEYRLWEGFIHWPVPFMGGRQMSEINAISLSPEMAPWHIRGESFTGDYSRPICRRIIEEAGVGRHLFATSKKAGAVLFRHYHSFLTPGSRQDFLNWLSENSVASTRLRRRRLPPSSLSMAASRVRTVALPMARGVDVAMSRLDPGNPSLIRRGARRLQEITQREPLFRFIFPWAIARAGQRYV